MTFSATARRALDAYGGADLWKGARSIDAVASVSGLAFRLKGRPFFHHAAISMEVARPICRLTPIGKEPGVTGVLQGENVALQAVDGTIIAERSDARRYFPSLRRTFRWDDLDMAYFANYAFWNYFTLPALLMREDIDWKEISPGVLEAVFPPHLPSHCVKQRFFFDETTGRLLRHEYAVDIISRFAKVANVAAAHSEWNGHCFPSHRMATPLNKKGEAMRGPILIDIRVHAFTVHS